MAGFKFTVKLVLQQTKETSKLTPIRCYIRFNNTRCIVPSGISIEPRHWNPNSQEPRAKISLNNLDKIRADIKDVKSWIDSACKHITDKHGKYPHPEDLQILCKQVIQNNGRLPGEKSEAINYTLLSYFAKFIEDSKSGKRTKVSGGKITPGTIKTYNSANGVIKRFLEFKNRLDTGFDDVDLNFYYDLKDYSYNVLNLTDNYFGAVVKVLKTVLAEAAEDGHHKNTQHLSKRFISVSVEVENIYLTAAHLDKLEKLDLTDKPKLERVRDLFLIGCWTGLRFSDFNNIKASNFNGNYIDIKTQKTGQSVAIPIHPIVRSIMGRYEGKTESSLPPAMTNQKMNDYLKELCEEAKFFEPVTLEKSRAGHKLTVTKALWEVVSTHTARRAFASNMFKMGVPAIVIMGITGHTTEKSFMKYIKVTPREKAEMLMEVWNRKTMTAI